MSSWKASWCHQSPIILNATKSTGLIECPQILYTYRGVGRLLFRTSRYTNTVVTSINKAAFQMIIPQKFLPKTAISLLLSEATHMGFIMVAPAVQSNNIILEHHFFLFLCFCLFACLFCFFPSYGTSVLPVYNMLNFMLLSLGIRCILKSMMLKQLSPEKGRSQNTHDKSTNEDIARTIK